MVRSLRARLQLWYALVLAAVVLGFASLLYYQVRSARLAEVEAELTAAAAYLDSALRAFPPPALEEEGFVPPHPPPPPPPPPPERDRPGWPRPFPPPPGPHRPGRPLQQLLAELAPPQRPGPPGEPAEGYFAVWRADGSVLKSSGLAPDIQPPAPEEVGEEPQLLRREGRREVQMRGPRGTRILVGRWTRRVTADLAVFAWQLAGAGVVVLLVGLAGGWLISSRIVRPIAAISATASRISAANLSERVEGPIDSELAGLAAVLNETFDRLQSAFDQQSRFTADASHELRTPLTVIRTHAELALFKPRPAEEYRQTLETVLKASGRMTAIVEGLLLLARADAGQLALLRERIDLTDLVDESVELIRPLAQEKGLTLEADLQRVQVEGDPEALARVVGNLLSNAVGYNRPGGRVGVALRLSNTEAILTVSDTGVGIPEADQAHVFERFYRVDRARSRASGGMGLGLAICKSIVEAHGGAIGFETRVGEGSVFRVSLPLAGGGTA